jgi:hypothetical protein
MKKIISAIILSLMVIIFSDSAMGQKADFTGTWKIDNTKIPVTGNFPVLIRININIKGDSLLTERIYNTGDGREYPFNENLTLDGKEYLMTVYEMPRKSVASWKEKDVILVHQSTTTANGSNGPVDFKSTETWTVDSVNHILTISFRNTSYEGELTGAFIFNKSDKTN